MVRRRRRIITRKRQRTIPLEVLRTTFDSVLPSFFLL